MRARDLAAPEQPLDRALRIAPLPPALAALLADLDRAGDDRPALGDSGEDVAYERRPLLLHLAHVAPRMIRRALHAPAQQRLQRDRQQRRLVPPVLEQRA